MDRLTDFRVGIVLERKKRPRAELTYGLVLYGSPAWSIARGIQTIQADISRKYSS